MSTNAANARTPRRTGFRIVANATNQTPISRATAAAATYTAGGRGWRRDHHLGAYTRPCPFRPIVWSTSKQSGLVADGAGDGNRTPHYRLEMRHKEGLAAEISAPLVPRHDRG
jgi:hypothetical protein